MMGRQTMSIKASCSISSTSRSASRNAISFATHHHGKAPDEIDWSAPERQTRAVAEFIPDPELENSIGQTRKCCPVARHVRSALDTVEKVFLGRWPKFSWRPLMRFVHDDVRDLVASQKNDHGLRIGATAHPNGEVVSKISICEIFGVVRFSTFSTASPREQTSSGHPLTSGFVKFAFDILHRSAYNILFDRPVDGGTGALIYVQSPRYYQGSAINRPLRSSIMDIDPEEHDIMDQVNATPTPHKRLPWNKR